MFSPKVILWGGLAGALGGVFWLMIGIAPSSAGIVSALVLGLGGLAGLYSRQAGQGGRLGLTGFALGIVGTVLALAALGWGFTSGRLSKLIVDSEPVLAAPGALVLFLALFILGLGLALLGVASLRGKIPHRWRGLPLGLGLVNTLMGMTGWLAYYLPLSQGRDPWHQWNFAAFVLAPAVYVLLGICWLSLGVMLATEANAQTAPPEASAETRQ